jgi:hypothetical protein
MKIIKIIPYSLFKIHNTLFNLYEIRNNNWAGDSRPAEN